MSEAEKKWKEFDYQKMQDYWNGENGFIPEDDPDKISKVSREAYKAALRREIEKQIEFYNAMAKAAETKSEYIEALRTIDGLGITIELLDTVEP